MPIRAATTPIAISGRTANQAIEINIAQPRPAAPFTADELKIFFR